MSLRRLTALSSPLSLLCFLLTAGAGLAADQWTKVAAFERLSSGVRWDADGSVQVIHPRTYEALPGWVHFRVTANRGAVFGVGQGRRSLFIGVSIAAVGFMFYMFALSDRNHFYQIILGMLLAGVLGNLYDRFHFGYVRDMIFALPRWPNLFPYIFNVADSMLCVGVGLMILHSFLHTPSKAETGATAPAGAD